MRLSLVLGSVRVRFAPSPTGQLHLGGLRTLLVNFLFARGQGGALLLRIEDTDQSRLVPGAVQALLDVAHWAGLHFDEGPVQGGDRGPYVQSQRTSFYKAAAEDLVASDAAYPCFCSTDRLFLLKKAALKDGRPPRYDNRCGHLPHAEAQARVRQGKPHTLRLRLPNVSTTHNDLVFGRVTQETDEGDPILLKSDGLPTYHLANVVDDHHMGITHVIRGQEWLPSVPKHRRLYAALGWEAPAFAHLPLMVNSKGHKLSKRNEDAFVEHYRRQGHSPTALLNYVTRSGGGFRGGKDLSRLATLEEMVADFDLALLKRSPLVTDTEWIAKFNKMSMAEEPEEVLEARLVELLEERLEAAELSEDARSPDFRRRVLRLARSRIGCLGDLLGSDWAFAWRLPADAGPLLKFHSAAEARELAGELSALLEEERAAGWDPKRISQRLRREVAERRAMKVSQLMRFVRLGLTGTKDGPPINDMLDLLGPDSVLQRLAHLRRLLHDAQ